MRNLTARLDHVEVALGVQGCTCAPLVVLFEAAAGPLSREQIDAQIAERHRCPVHASPTGQIVIIRRFGDGPVERTGSPPIRSGHGQL